MSKAMFIDQGYAIIAFEGGDRIETTVLGHNRYVRIDDRKQYPQLCAGARRTGNTLIYMSDEGLARDCGAKLYKTREGFERAAAKLAAIEPE